jgi:hypothetical protein
MKGSELESKVPAPQFGSFKLGTSVACEVGLARLIRSTPLFHFPLVSELHLARLKGESPLFYSCS